MKKILSMILACIMALSLLTACGGGGNDQPAQTEPPKQDEPAPEKTPDPEPAPAEDVTIQVAALASGYEEAYPGMWQEVCDAFTAATGIKVDLIVDKNLEDVIGPSMQGGEFPDVIHLADRKSTRLNSSHMA